MSRHHLTFICQIYLTGAETLQALKLRRIYKIAYNGPRQNKERLTAAAKPVSSRK